MQLVNIRLTSWSSLVWSHMRFHFTSYQWCPQLMEPIVVLDLLTAEGERLLWDYLKNCREIGIWHMACTTVRNMFTSKGYRKWRTSATQVRFRTWRSLWLKLWTSTESQHCKCAIHTDYKDHKFLLRWGTLLCGEPVFEHLLEDYRTQSHRTVWQFVRSVSRCMCVWI